MFIFRHSRAFCHRRWLMNSVCCQSLHIGTCSSQKKKWSEHEISLLTAWNYETDVICGPRIDPKKARNSVSKAKHKATHDISGDYRYLNNSKVTTGITANELSDDETQMLYLPHSVIRHLSPQTVLEDPVEELRSSAVINNSPKGSPTVTEKRQTDVINSKIASKDSSDDVLVLTKRKGTYGYTWVDSPAQLPPANSTENAAASFARTTNSNKIVRNVEQVGRRTGKLSSASTDTAKVSDTGREQLLNSLATESLSAEDKAQKNTSDQYILSFPLFGSPTLSTETASRPTRLPSVSAILKATMSPESQLVLTRWEQRMIAELGEDGFKEYQKGCYSVLFIAKC